ncbi:MAG: cell division protein FtsH [Bdellovibrionaceae bacterium]|nr:cell division protein FtsH [Pseudobdellovibrionaceae bacterium]
MKELERTTKFNIWYILIAILFVVMIRDFWANQSQVKHVPYSEFQQLLESKQIKKVTLRGEQVQGELTAPKEGEKFVHTTRVEFEMAKDLQKYGVEFERQVENRFFQNVLSWVLPVLIFFAIWSFIAKRAMGQMGGMQGGFMSVGKSKAKIYVEKDTKVTFSDVAGADEAKSELQELVEFLKSPDKYNRLGSRMPKGILLVGPPGTGKTLIARAVAGEAGVPFFSTNGAEFVEMFVGVGAARVRDLFEQARKKSPCIIFIDELDALGRTRLSGMGHGNDEKEQTLNQLLAELDGFDSSSGIILLAATNRPEILDPALLRSGRFDRQVLVDKPDKDGRLAILKLHVKKTRLKGDTDLEKVAALTPGFTGADLANLVNEASLVALRRNGEEVSEADFTAAIERMIAGLEKKNRLINPFEKKVVAHHEMGHAIVSKALQANEAIHKVSIIPRGIGSLGYTIQRPTEDRYLMTKTELQGKMAGLLGGRAAELLIFSHLSTGAADDLDKATEIAWNAVTRYGMNEKLGFVVYDKAQSGFLGDGMPSFKARLYSDETAREIDCAVRDLLKSALDQAKEILFTNLEILKTSAEVLMEKETLTEKELEPFFSRITISGEHPK